MCTGVVYRVSLTDLIDHYGGGAIKRMSAAALEMKLTNVCLNKDWNKTVYFVYHASLSYDQGPQGGL